MKTITPLTYFNRYGARTDKPLSCCQTPCVRVKRIRARSETYTVESIVWHCHECGCELATPASYRAAAE